MNFSIAGKDLLLLRRASLVRGLFVVSLALFVCSLLSGLQRERVFDKEKAAAQATDRSVWMEQGDRNPHSAAHFSRYAFRPASPLGLLDPGIADFAGLAIWMEAHYQDPAVFRRAEDGGELSRYAQLTPAFLLLSVAPLLVFLMLYDSIAGEREDGTLRQLLATGVGAREFFLGKLGAGLRMTVLAYTAVFAPLALLSVLLSPAAADADTWLRLLALYVTYAAYLAASVAVAIAVSSLFATRQAAFMALACAWVLLAVIVPQFAADVATGIHPQPDARDAATRLSAASNIFYADQERRDRIEKEVLDRYGVASPAELPINFGAYLLQVSEELSEPEFDRFYASLDARYTAQENMLRWFSPLTPAIAAASLSRGLAGTDRVHQRAFADAAESHRRKMIRLLNEDYMYNAADAGAAYTADARLWAEFEDLDYRLPGLRRVGGAYFADVAVLLAWLLGATAVAWLLVRRAARGEVTTT